MVRILVGHSVSGSHTPKEGTCLVKWPSPNVVASCRLPSGLPIPAIPIFCLLPPLFLAFKSCPSFCCCTFPPFLSPLPLFISQPKKGIKEGEKEKASTMVSTAPSNSYGMLFKKLFPYNRWCMLICYGDSFL